MVTEDNTDKTEVGLDTNKIIVEVTLEETWGAMVDKIAEESIETALELTVMTEAGTHIEKGCFPEGMATILEIEVQATVGPGQDQEQVQIGIEFNVISVGKNDHFTRDCPTSREEKDRTAPTNTKFGRWANFSGILKHARQFQ